MIKIELITALGYLQLFDDGHRSVLQPGDDVAGLHALVQAVSAIATPSPGCGIELLAFDDARMVVLADGQAFDPDSDMSGHPQILADFHHAVYTVNAGQYADAHAFLYPPAEPVEPEPLTPEQILAAQIRAIEKEFEDTITGITAGYTASEVQTWDQQKSEAEAFDADQGAATPFLDAMVATSGRDKAELVTAILAKAAAFAAAVGAALGRKQAAIAALEG